MLEIKWWCPGDSQSQCALHFLVLSYSQNGYGKDFLMYGHDPRGLLVVYALRLCINTSKAKINEDNPFGQGRWARSLQLSLSRIVCAVYTCVHKCELLLSLRKTVLAWYCLMVCCTGNEMTRQVHQVKALTLLHDLLNGCCCSKFVVPGKQLDAHAQLRHQNVSFDVRG